MGTDLWTYPETVGRMDLTGFEVEAVDGSIGKVDEATNDVGESYVVVDTGVWIFGNKVLLPAGVIERTSSFCHGRPATTKSTRSNWRVWRTLTAVTRWPTCGGSNVPPNTPIRSPAPVTLGV